eukprot:TRINITY_DN48921_c0_g1_i1.p1 TRINITY_DN48921_c0_g1~~TRINITY_DN48921_c0_g1_i1.p1  ORF type:complete len:1294 (+),score=252.21 TRINITY_DN48921_c0_g1_i1:64-3882(+)
MAVMLFRGPESYSSYTGLSEETGLRYRAKDRAHDSRENASLGGSREDCSGRRYALQATDSEELTRELVGHPQAGWLLHSQASNVSDVLQSLRCLEEAEPSYWRSPGGAHDPSEPLLRASVDGLQEAVLRGELHVVAKQIAAGAPVNAPLRIAGGDEYLTLLHVIACKPALPNGIQIALQLIDAHASPDARSTLGTTPLMLACDNKYVAMAEVFLDAGVNTDTVDSHHKTALRYAVGCDCLDLSRVEASTLSVNLIMSLHLHGASLDKGGDLAPITEAIIQNNLPAVTMLLELGAAPAGLHEALADKSITLIKELLAADASPYERGKDDLSCLEVALRRGEEDITETLRTHMSDLERSRSKHLHLKEFTTPKTKATTLKGKQFLAELLTGAMDDNPVIEEEFDLEGNSLRDRDGGCLSWTRQKVRRALRNPVSQAVFNTNLCAALFLTDIWQIMELQAYNLDIILVIMFSVFVTEILLQSFAYGRHYIGKMEFWIDLVGAISVPIDHSLVADSFINMFQGSGMARVTKFVKLGTRAGRLSRLVKLFRYLPAFRQGRQLQDSQTGTATGISVELNVGLAIRVACIIIFMVIVFPVMEFMRHPVDDEARFLWADAIEATILSYPQDIDAVIQDLSNFYRDKATTYFPFAVLYTPDYIGRNTTDTIRYAIQGAQAPMRDKDIETIQSTGSTARILFNFRGPNTVESICMVALITSVCLIMFVASNAVSRVTQREVISPLDELLRAIQSVSTKIFVCLEKMALLFVKDHANRVVDDEEEEKDGNVLLGFGHEIRTLSKVLLKLDVLNQISKAKRKVDEFEQLCDTHKVFLADYATLASRRYDSALEQVAGDLDKEYLDVEPLKESMGRELDEADIAREDYNNWDFHSMDLNYMQRMGLARCLIVNYDTAPGFMDGKVVELKKYSCHAAFVKALEKLYEDDQTVPYHNWLHAVDVSFTLQNIMRLWGAERYFSMHERFAMMVAAMAHDIGHPGLNETFLRTSRHDLSIMYNDKSCLQNMACARLFDLTSRPETAIFLNFDKPSFREVREAVVSAILSTDMKQHGRLMAELEVHHHCRQELFKYIYDRVRRTGDESQIPLEAHEELQEYLWNVDVKLTWRNVLVHLADLSNSLKSWDLCCYWADLQFEEFFRQGDLERGRGLPVGPLNDRDQVNIPFAQISFMKIFIVPQTLLITKMIPALYFCVDNMWSNLERWIELWKDTGANRDRIEQVREELLLLRTEDEDTEVAAQETRNSVKSEAPSKKKFAQKAFTRNFLNR